MGVVRKQSIAAFLLTSVGLVLGYVNKAVLFANILRTDYYGLVEFYVAGMAILASVAFLGIPSVVSKYYHYLKPHRRILGSFNVMVLALPALAMLVMTLLLLVLRPVIAEHFAEKSPLVGEKFWYFIMLLFAYVWFELFAAYSSSIVKNVVPAFLRDVALRIFQTVIILLLWFGNISEEGFLILFVGGYWVNLFLAGIYLRWLGKFPLGLHLEFFKSRYFRSIWKYAAAIFLTTLGWSIVQRGDIVMLGFYEDLQDVAVYSVAVYLGTLIYIPGRLLFTISLPLFARAFKERNMDEVRQLYSKSSLNNYVIGGALIILIFFNLDSLLSFMKPEFQAVKWPALILLAGKWFDISTGATGALLLSSRYYWYVLAIVAAAALLGIAGNMILIPLTGLMGAASIAAAGSVVINSAFVWVIYRKYHILPFSARHLLLLPVVAGTALVAWLIPVLDHAVADIAVRTVVPGLIYVSAVLALGISEDMNAVAAKFFSRFRKSGTN